MPSTSQPDARRRVARWAILFVLAVIVAGFSLPSSASAASCPVTPGVFATAWLGGSGNLGAENWTNGTPTGSCDVTIASPGSDVITMTGGANMRSLTLGGVGSTPQLIISDQSPNTNLDAQPAGITIAAGASVTLTCQPGGCPNGGPDIYSGPSPFSNAGTITVDANTGGGAGVGGVINNTGTLNFEQSGSLSGQVTNKGSITVANGATATNSGSSCGGTEPFVKNDTGGTISGTGTGTLSVINFEQGNGTSEDIVIPCGSLKYSGNGASEVRAYGGFNLTGELQSNQALTIFAASNNTNAVLQGNITNKGQITITCPEGGCSGGSGGGVGFNVNDKDFVNAGTFTVAAASGTGGGIGANSEGTIVNTGTMQFDQNAYLGGPVTNKGKINIATGKTATSSGSSCGDTGGFVKNDTGGSINGTGSGFLSVLNFEQGNGTTSGSSPVQIPCGSLKYTGTGAGVVQVNGGGTPMTGNVAAGQTLRLVGGVSLGAFTNAGTIVLDQTGSSPTLNSGAVTNTGTIETAGPSGNTSTVNGQIDQTGAAAQVVVPAGTKLQLNSPPLLLKAGTLSGGGTINGSVENSGGVVSPGTSPGTLSLNGNFTQGAGGRLDIEIAGTGAGEYDALTVSGSATLAGTVALIPTGGYQDSAAVGDTVAFLTYGGILAGGFGTTTVKPSLACPKQLTVSSDAGAKALKAVVSDSGASCGGEGGGGGGGTVTQPPPVVPPTIVIDTPPKKKTCPKSKRLKKGRCVPKKCPKGKKLKKGRCVKKKQPKARPAQR
jgi:fibronectin-binding autotransporter adhesin